MLYLPAMLQNRTNLKLGITILMLLLVFRLPAQPNINRVEYFFDSDPGFGAGTTLVITPATNLNNIPVTVNIASLGQGIHSLFIRSRNADGYWSQTNVVPFVKLAATALTVIQAEYFFDSDPGFGAGTGITVTQGADLADIPVTLNLTALPQGMHMLFIRSRASDSRWSEANAIPFVKLGTPDVTVVQAEYFFDSDPGIGKAIPVVMNPGNPKANFAIPANITGLSGGTHIFFLRTLASDGKWSLTNPVSFAITSANAAPRIQINAVTSRQLCAYGSFDLSFDATGTYNTGNIFEVEMSDANGNFSSPVVIGSIAATVSAKLKCVLPSHLPDGDNYKLRVVSTNPAVTGVAADTLMKLRDRPELGPDTLAAIVCLGETVDLNPLYNTNGLTATWSTQNTASAPKGNYTLMVENASGCRDTAVATVGQDINYWNGNTSNDWHNPANWSRSRVPSSKTHVIVSGAKPNACRLSLADAVIASLQIKSGGTVNVTNGKKITVVANCNPLPGN